MDPYRVLNVSRNSTEEQIRESYREKVKEVHPDAGGSVEDFRRVQKAYEILIEESDEVDVTGLSEIIYPARVDFIDYEYVSDNNLDANRSVFDRNVPEDASGSFIVNEGETVLQAAERAGYSWPFSCRGGACSNCAVKVVEGDFRTPNYAILTDELLNKGYRLSCIGKPLTAEIKVICGVRDHEEIEELLLPSR